MTKSCLADTGNPSAGGRGDEEEGKGHSCLEAYIYNGELREPLVWPQGSPVSI